MELNKERKLEKAQIDVEITLKKLIERVEGLSYTVGYTLENAAYKGLPSLLKNEGIEVEGKLLRKYYSIMDEKYQLNVFGWGRKDGNRVLILGEIKVRPSKKEIKRFLKIAEKIKENEGNPETLLLFVAHDYHPDIESFLNEKGIKYYWSYEF